MAKGKKQIPIQEIAISNMVSIEELVRVLVKRGLITQSEVLKEIRQVKLEQETKRN